MRKRKKLRMRKRIGGVLMDDMDSDEDVVPLFFGRFSFSLLVGSAVRNEMEILLYRLR